MIVDPFRHLADIGALMAMFIFAYALAWTIARISESGQRTGTSLEPADEDAQAAPRLSPAPIPVNDNPSQPDRSAARRAA